MFVYPPHPGDVVMSIYPPPTSRDPAEGAQRQALEQAVGPEAATSAGVLLIKDVLRGLRPRKFRDRDIIGTARTCQNIAA